ncbi:hypothetical protein BOX37_26775 [Nocardia mangyaensis]|uniref:Uncharacterized protein n=1 Tax=Nocardia mangyaensis TaxID=2213200 RepID=A0A1J0VY65_9NOCA|nr:hypothetical protein [Nocardia mangyaensis]APE36941.1 hypothetical protein BOX37_26775 [Nocardia mangyaensis]
MNTGPRRDLSEELYCWDVERWRPRAVARRLRDWLDCSRWRRWTAWSLLVVSIALVLPAVLGAVALAQSGTLAQGSANSGLSWMQVRDSDGVLLSDYRFVTDHGSVLEPGKTALALVLELEFAGYMVLVTTAVWLIGYALSFSWLDMFAQALTGVADALAGQLATPILLVTAATIGAFFVGWFIVRGNHAKATTQVVTMLAVAVFGPLFLAEPLADVLSSDGLLAKGRDIGISVAAGLNGHLNPNPSLLVETMQGDLADGFARQPLQVWNFGHVLDERVSCGAQWSSGMRAGDSGQVKKGLEACNDTYALESAGNPSAGQIGTGLLLLICATILLVFALYLSVKVIKSALDAIYHGFMAIFGFAAGGFVYGPTQTFLIRNLVDSVMAAAQMAVFTIFLGVYVLFLTNVFAQARGQVMAVFVIGAIVELVAFSQLRRLSKSLRRGNEWMANRFALATQGQGGANGGGGGGGGGESRALGMGDVAVAGALGGGLGGLAGFAALSTISGSPATEWLLGRTRNPLAPYARRRQRTELAQMSYTPLLLHRHEWLKHNRESWMRAAQRRAEKAGGVDDPLKVANIIDGLYDSGIPKAELNGALADLTYHGKTVDPMDVLHVDRAIAVQNASKSQNPYGFAPLQKALAAWESVNNHPVEPGRSLREHRAFAAQAHIAATNFARHSRIPHYVNGNADIDWAFVNDVRQNWDSSAALHAAISPDRWNRVGANTRHYIGSELANEHRDAVMRYYNNPVTANRMAVDRIARRISNLDHLDPEAGLDPWDS